MRIVTIEATPFSLPRLTAIALSPGARSSADHVLVRVTTEDGVRGHAECVPRPSLYGETFATAPSVIVNELAPLVAGVPVSDLQEIHRRLAKVAANPSARSAI